MSNVRRVYVEKKPDFAVKAKELKHEIKHYLGITTVEAVRVLIRYDVENISEETYKKALYTVFSEPPVDDIYEETFDYGDAKVFTVEFLPGQFDQRADSAEQCVKLLNENEEPIIRSAITYVIEGAITDEQFAAIKKHCINPVDSRAIGMEKPKTLVQEFDDPADVIIFDGFKDMAEDKLKELYLSLNLAMTFKDFLHIQNYFKNEEKRDPSMTEIRVLDPFWDSKGLVTPEDWRAFCAPTVALLRYPKSAWFEDETFTAKAEVYNFGAAALKNAKIRWSITDGSGKAIAKGSLKSQTVGTDGVFPVGEFSAPLGKVRGPQKLTVHLNVGEKTSNSWDIWVYPRNAQLMQSDTEVLYTTEFGEQAKQYLAAGKKVVLTPAPNKVKGRKSTFHNHFWNPIMFAWAPMTIGCLIHAEQPVFADFPTSYHTDWQWWDILENAKVIEMQQTPRQLRPFIQVIDSFDNNEKLGIGFEARVGGGKLLVLAVDTKKKMDQRPATRQLLESIDRYVRSDRFAPEVTLDESFITSFMR